MIVFLSESDVQAAITMPETLTIVEAAFRDHALGQATILPRVSQTLPGTAGMFRILSATLPTRKMFGLKTLTGFPGRRLEDEVYFAILLFEMGSGALRAVISANYLTGLRTGAASGVAAKYLAREDASSLGIVGAGVQAWFQAEALCAVRPIDTVKIFSRNKNRAKDLALRLCQSFPVDAVAVESAQDAVQGSDLVIAATTASTPVIQGDWLEPGTHVSAIGANTRTKRELDASCFERARVVADSREEVLHESSPQGCTKAGPPRRRLRSSSPLGLRSRMSQSLRFSLKSHSVPASEHNSIRMRWVIILSELRRRITCRAINSG
jgi:alanine dehydrogenase